MTPNDAIKWITAFRDGEELEYRMFKGRGAWFGMHEEDGTTFEFLLDRIRLDYDLRIKPKEPKYYWANEYDDYASTLYPDPELAETFAKPDRLRRLKLMVVDDD